MMMYVRGVRIQNRFVSTNAYKKLCIYERGFLQTLGARLLYELFFQVYIETKIAKVILLTTHEYI